MLLSYGEICELIEAGIIENADYDNVNSSSLDLVMYDEVVYELVHEVKFGQYGDGTTDVDLEHIVPFEDVIDLAKKETISTEKYTMDDGGFVIHPGEFALLSSLEVFNLPQNISAVFKLKSSMARCGLNALNAGWCDAGWHGSRLTTQFHNTTQAHKLLIKPGMKLGQMVFFKHKPVPAERSYAARGQYNNDLNTQGSKGIV